MINYEVAHLAAGCKIKLTRYQKLKPIRGFPLMGFILLHASFQLSSDCTVARGTRDSVQSKPAVKGLSPLTPEAGFACSKVYEDA